MNASVVFLGLTLAVPLAGAFIFLQQERLFKTLWAARIVSGAAQAQPPVTMARWELAAAKLVIIFQPLGLIWFATENGVSAAVLAMQIAGIVIPAMVIGAGQLSLRLHLRLLWSRLSHVSTPDPGVREAVRSIRTTIGKHLERRSFGRVRWGNFARHINDDFTMRDCGDPSCAVRKFLVSG